jgi:hypothetical protein
MTTVKDVSASPMDLHECHYGESAGARSKARGQVERGLDKLARHFRLIKLLAHRGPLRRAA